MRHALSVAAAATASLALLIPSAASADDITASSTDFQVVADQNTIVLTVGDAASVTLSYAQAQLDGKPGCNLQGGGSQLGLDTVATPDATDGPAGLSGMPASVVFASCDDETGADSVVQLSFTAVSPGTTTFSFVRNGATVTNSPEATYDTTGATFVVTVLAPQEEVGRDAPAIANDWLHNTATASQLAACQAANGTNRFQANWHGKLIGKIAQLFEGRSFSASQEQVVIDQVKAYCGL